MKAILRWSLTLTRTAHPSFCITKEYAFWICTLLEFARSDPAKVVEDKGGLVGVAEFESAINCWLSLSSSSPLLFRTPCRLQPCYLQ